MNPGIVALLVVAGGAGAVVRFVADGTLNARLGRRFPWATLIINVSGSLLLGILTGLMMFHGAPEQWKAVLGTGFCGGYTTFSTASAETVALARRGAVTAACANLLGSALLCLAAAGLGLLVTH